mgnify:CR=1 FL=1
MSKFAEALNSGRFVITCELNPPKGADLRPLYNHANEIRKSVEAFNITDSAGARMTMAPLSVAHLLLDRGIEPILQVTCRDRNRLALQSELLAASSLGVTNVLCMSGDHPSGGDHPEAKAVFDLDGISLLRSVSSLNAGSDLSGNALRGSPNFFAGAVVNPGAANLDEEIRRMEQKIEAGASFFQTQAVYEPESFEKFMNAAHNFNVPILAGIIVLKSSRMARNLNANLPGVHVPGHIIDELESADDVPSKSVEVSGRIIRDVREMCAGVHIMAIGWESRVPSIVSAAGLDGNH